MCSGAKCRCPCTCGRAHNDKTGTCDYCLKMAERAVMRDISLAVDELCKVDPRIAKHFERCIVAQDGAIGYFPERDGSA